MPVVFNLVCIAALLTLSRLLPTPGHALAVGVLVAGVVQLAWLLIACARAGLAIRPHLPRPTLALADPAVRLVLRRLGPGLVGAGVAQLNIAIGVVVASLLPAGTVAVLYYADRVNQLPLGVIGAAVGTAILPAFVADRAGGRAIGPRLDRGLRGALVLALPAAAALMVLAHPITAVLFGRGAFTPHAVDRSAAALAAYAIGLPATIAARLFAPAFSARGDTATPVRLGLIAVGANLVASLALIPIAGPLAPPIAASLAATGYALILAQALARAGDWTPGADLARALGRIVLATLAMAAVLALAAMPLRAVFAVAGPGRWLALAGIVSGGLACYAVAGQLLGAFDLRGLSRLRASRADRLG